MLDTARNCPRLSGTLALLLAAGPASARQAASSPELGSPEPAPLETTRLEAIYSAANEATAAGDHITAAERYADVLDLLPESRENHESRALALLDSVAARRRAHASGAAGSQLCRARDLVEDYLVTARATHGVLAAELDGVRQAERLRDELSGEIAGLSDPTCPEDPPSRAAPHHPPLQLAPAPTPVRDRRGIAGAALLGTSGVAVGLMALGLGLGARAEQAGREARAADPTRDIDDLSADGFLQRGQAGNRLAIAGGVLAGVTMVAGIVLLVLARTRPRHAGAGDGRSARRPRATALPGGLGLRF